MANYGWKWSLFLFADTVGTLDVLTESNEDVKIELKINFLAAHFPVY